MRNEVKSNLQRIEALLASIGEVGIAVSGGVDSMTLATIAGRTYGCSAMIFHATSPAVPRAARERVEAYATREGWTLRIVDAGEMRDAAYVSNPANRCFFCKQNLYSSIAQIYPGVVLSGTNVDDLSDYRPGLQAAEAHGVRHPYVEAEIDKHGIRAIADLLGLGDISALPASPCLSSRIETTIPISSGRLAFVEEVEGIVALSLKAAVIRCRIRQAGIVIELDANALARLTQDVRLQLADGISAIGARLAVPVSQIRYAAYRQGSAFLVRGATLPASNV